MYSFLYLVSSVLCGVLCSLDIGVMVSRFSGGSRVGPGWGGCQVRVEVGLYLGKVEGAFGRYMGKDGIKGALLP